MTSILSEFEEDQKDYTQLPSDTDLKSVQLLAKQAADLFQKVKLNKSILEDLEKEYNQLVNFDLPNQMTDIGLSEIKLEDGTKIVVQDVVNVRLPSDEADREKAFEWLNTSGNGSIVNHVVSCAFQKNEVEKIEELKNVLVEAGFNFQDKKDVHWKTLEALIKDLIKNGEEVPRDIFSIFEGRVAKLK